jgi:HSP20 family protein
MDIIPFRRKERGLARLQDSMNDLLGRFFEEDFPFAEPTWPALDVAERDDAVEVKAELPGVKPQDIELTMQGNTLVISGQKKEETEQKEKNFYRSERRYGSFRRTIPLPAGVDAAKIDASHKDGVLTILLPKSEQAKPKKITVKAA